MRSFCASAAARSGDLVGTVSLARNAGMSTPRIAALRIALAYRITTWLSSTLIPSPTLMVLQRSPSGKSDGVFNVQRGRR